jgi:magnesium-protoporphyrin O-methyltransferase
VHARRAVVFSYPSRNIVSRIFVAAQNFGFRLLRKEFRTFVHPPSEMLSVLEEGGLRPAFSRHGRVWQVAGVARPNPAL